MSDYEVGYGKPPKHSQFKKGVSQNPSGRRKRSELKFGDVLKNVLYAKIRFRENGKLKKATRLELAIKKLGAAAIKGDVASAAWLLRLRAHALKHGDTTPITIVFVGGLPD